VLELSSLLDRMFLESMLVIKLILKDKCNQNHMGCKFLIPQHRRILKDKANID